MANKKALDLDQLKTSLSAVKNWTSGEITNATKNKADKDIVEKLKNKTDTLTPANTVTTNPAVLSNCVAGNKLKIKASWIPTQSGTGNPSTTNIRAIDSGKTSVTISRQEDSKSITLTLPETIYGGEVDEQGNGQKTYEFIELDGTINKFTFNDSSKEWRLPKNSTPGSGGIFQGFCSHFHNMFSIHPGGDFLFVESSRMASLFSTVDEFNAYLVAQKTAGTPVQVIYRLIKEPTSFTATGGEELIQIDGTNTISTDAPTLTVDQYTSLTDLQYPTAQAVKKYVDDNITEAGGEYIPLSGGEFEFQNRFKFNNVPMIWPGNFSNALFQVNGADATFDDGSIWQYEYVFPYEGSFLMDRTEKGVPSDQHQYSMLMPHLLFIANDLIRGDHRKMNVRAESINMWRYDNGWKNFWIKAEKDRTQIYNDQKLIDFNDSRLEKVGNPVDDSDAATKKYADTESKVAKRFVFDSDDNIIGVKIKDQVNNYNYILCMRNGTLATTCAVKSISITTNPTKMTYTAGSTIDTTGMIVTATCEDNSTREITGYTCTNTVTADNPKFTISYTEGGTTCTTELTVTVSAS